MYYHVENWYWFNSYGVSKLTQNVWNASATYYMSRETSWVAGSWKEGVWDGIQVCGLTVLKNDRMQMSSCLVSWLICRLLDYLSVVIATLNPIQYCSSGISGIRAVARVNWGIIQPSCIGIKCLIVQRVLCSAQKTVPKLPCSKELRHIP